MLSAACHRKPMQLIQHRVRIRAAVKHSPNNLRLGRHLGKLLSTQMNLNLSHIFNP